MRFNHIEASGYVLVGRNPERAEKNFGYPHELLREASVTSALLRIREPLIIVNVAKQGHRDTRME